MPQAFADNRQRVVSVADQGQDADKLRAAFGLRHVFEGIEQFGVVRRIALAIGIAGRVNAWRAAQSIHRQPRVVRQCGQAANARCIAGLKNGVLDKRQAGFFRLDAAELSNRAQLHRLAEHGLKFFEFARVVAGEYQLREVHHSIGATI